MRFTDLIVTAAAVGSAHAAAADRKRQGGGFDFVGVNQAGAEFGQDTLPGQLGKHYTWPESSAIDVSGLPLPPKHVILMISLVFDSSSEALYLCSVPSCAN